jgi:hypothetical protein
VQYAKEPADTHILINAVCPGFTATDLNGFRGVRIPRQGAAAAIRLATVEGHGPTGRSRRGRGALVTNGLRAPFQGDGARASRSSRRLLGRRPAGEVQQPQPRRLIVHARFQAACAAHEHGADPVPEGTVSGG